MNPSEIVEAACVTVVSDPDIVAARIQGRAMAIHLGFPPLMATLVATVISELARNILLYAKRGEIGLTRIDQGDRWGLAIVARDEGPGIPDLSLAMQDGFSTSGRLGLGLPGVRRLMDEFEIRSGPGLGTVVEVKIWNP